MKTLKFQPELAQMIRDGSKTATWRLNDDKDLQVGDMVELIDRADMKVFNQAKITQVIEKPLGQLTDEDRQGHEPFSSDQSMLETFAKYYHQPVGPETIVKIVRFQLQK